MFSLLILDKLDKWVNACTVSEGCSEGEVFLQHAEAGPERLVEKLWGWKMMESIAGEKVSETPCLDTTFNKLMGEDGWMDGYFPYKSSAVVFVFVMVIGKMH